MGSRWQSNLAQSVPLTPVLCYFNQAMHHMIASLLLSPADIPKHPFLWGTVRTHGFLLISRQPEKVTRCNLPLLPMSCPGPGSGLQVPQPKQRKWLQSWVAHFSVSFLLMEPLWCNCYCAWCCFKCPLSYFLFFILFSFYCSFWLSSIALSSNYWSTLLFHLVCCWIL